MITTNLSSRFKGFNQFIIALLLLMSPLSGAYAACCAGHGGVASCNKSTSHQMCKDGTASPTCKCIAPKTTKPTTKRSKTMKTVPPTTSTTTKPKSNWWSGKSTTTTTKKTPNNGSAKGCCSRHGGIAQCNKSTGYQLCKDGTPSPTCTCQ